MSWCGEHLRDCEAWRSLGLTLSTTSDEAARYFDAVIRQCISWIECDELGGFDECIKQMHKADPDFVMGNVLSLGLDLMGTGKTTRLDTEFRDQILALTSKSESEALTKRERMHVKAIGLFADGFSREACVVWEDILSSHPRDLLALKFAHDAYFYLGDRTQLRDSVARVLPHFDKGQLLHGHVKGMMAFGLEECDEYDEALKIGREALDINRQDAWATHAVAHVYEMTGRFDEGIAFLSTTLKDWNPCGILACHNHWHWGVYHIEKGNFDTVLGMFDREIGKRVESGALLDIVDANSILFRLQLEGVDVGSARWNVVEEQSRGHSDDHILVFNDAHIAMAALGAANTRLCDEQTQSLLQYVKSNVGTNAELSRELGVPLLGGLRSFADGDYSAAAELLSPLDIQRLRPIGGSNAQRDVFDLLRVHAHLRSPDLGHQQRAGALICEREARKSNSPLNARLRARFTQLHSSA